MDRSSQAMAVAGSVREIAEVLLTFKKMNDNIQFGELMNEAVKLKQIVEIEVSYLDSEDEQYKEEIENMLIAAKNAVALVCNIEDQLKTLTTASENAIALLKQLIENIDYLR